MLTVGVVYGGCSPEHEVSVRSAKTVIQYLDYNRFKVLSIYISLTGQWTITTNAGFEYTTKIPTYLECDVIFSVLHGAYGEDGHMQSMFEIWDLPYIGSGVLGSAVGMDKVISKKLIVSQRIAHIVPYIYFSRQQWNLKSGDQLNHLKSLGYPVFVKPISAGSSIGIQCARDRNEAIDAIKHALKFDNYIIVEKALNIREIEVGVLESLNENDAPLISVAGEILTQHDFYSYTAKYNDSVGTQIKIPAPISIEQLQSIYVMATNIFKLLRLEIFARIDFFLDDINNLIYFNEVNTLPGFTEGSMYPKLWEASNKSMTQLLTHMIELALKRHKKRIKF